MAASLRSTRSVAKAVSHRTGRMDHRLSAHSTPEDRGCHSLSVRRPRSVRLDRCDDRFPSRTVEIWQKMASTDVREGSGEAVVDIAAWLQRLGLEQYEPAFRANAIDAAVLPKTRAAIA